MYPLFAGSGLPVFYSSFLAPSPNSPRDRPAGFAERGLVPAGDRQRVPRLAALGHALARGGGGGGALVRRRGHVGAPVAAGRMAAWI